MSAPVKDVLLIGLGAIGSVYALVLQRSGLVRVTAVARSNYATIERDGLHIKSARYGEQVGWRPDRLCNSVASAADRAYSYVILTTKALPDVSPTSALLAPLLTPPYSDKFDQPTYVFLQNGLNVEADVYGMLERLEKGTSKVVSAAVYTAADMARDNVVEHNANIDHISIGMYHPDSSPSPPAPALTDFQEMLEKGGANSTMVPSIYNVKFAKNFWNIAWSCTATLTTYPPPSLWRPPPKDGEVYENGVYVSESTKKWVEEYTLPTMRAVLKEVLSVARAIGIPDLPAPQGIPSSFVDSTLRDTAALYVVASNNHRPSMLVDAQEGRPIEVEVILGEVVREARKRGVSVPRIEMIYALLIVVQNQTLRKIE
ncbi:6-phosphogluconate dehydrogenase C-terminal domain-like protein, partial [Athelia psychrophila]